ncbi:hypothetical protein [Blastococcus mobilis]|uniref:Tail assembly chaperone n=1 Tax=Blastococcus mobilis TaxID=1938746 RepID=A0A238VWR4_9ACTN|nr:hypothetical protein [Blastococcus mobilis]SNR38688.1 hypothetical protein SAMN06272737_105112 [Blastococcus mobilis]
MKISTIRRNPAASFTRELVLSFGEEELHVSVFPTGLDAELQAEVRAVPQMFAELGQLAKRAVDAENPLTDEEKAAGEELEVRVRRALGAGIAALVVKWDLADDDGTPIPPTPEALAEVDLFVLFTIVDTLMREVNAGPFGKTSRSSGKSGRTGQKRRRS